MTVSNIEALYDLLVSCGGPVYARYYTPGDETGHLVVVTGVDLDKGYVYTNNPWGVKGKQTFENFQKSYAKKWWDFFSTDVPLNCIYIVDYGG